jgi:protoheme IX farnesyltransferase
MKHGNVMDTLSIYGSLCKMKVALLVTFSSITGYLLANQMPGATTLFLAAGVFFLACGSCALNQYQDRAFDARMCRTKDRPLPAGKVSAEAALLFSVALTTGGLAILFSAFGGGPSAIALSTLFWYNGVYTYWKRKSAFAVVPGALIGSAPPIIGWVAGGGTLSDFRIWAFSFFIFMWQMPHFWLLLLEHSEEYKRAGLPVLDMFSEKQIRRVVSQWLFATAVSCQLLSVFVVSPFFTKCLLFSLSLLLVALASGLLKERIRSYMTTFRMMNMIFFAALLVLFSDGLSRIRHLPVEKIIAQL